MRVFGVDLRARFPMRAGFVAGRRVLLLALSITLPGGKRQQQSPRVIESGPRESDPAGIFSRADDHERSIARTKDFLESSVPSGNAATALLRLGNLLRHVLCDARVALRPEPERAAQGLQQTPPQGPRKGVDLRSAGGAGC